MQVLDHGYLTLIEHWGSDERIIESARMSTDGAFRGWGGAPCPECLEAGRILPDGLWKSFPSIDVAKQLCQTCKGDGKTHGDERLLRHLWVNKHTTPFEMAGLTIEVQAPIAVIREWHRHRTQSYSELSARYAKLPALDYRPTADRIINGVKPSSNKQAAGTHPLLIEAIDDWLKALDAAYAGIEQTYQAGLAIGIPKELARLVVPVGRYSRMRASANLLNWFRFLTLRQDESAQWEIRQYANALSGVISVLFPRTHALYAEERKR